MTVPKYGNITMVSWQASASNLFHRFMVKPLTERGISAVQMREGVSKMESLYTEYPTGFTYTHAHPLPHCEAEWIGQTDVQTDRMLLHFPGGAYFMRMPRMERALVTGICRAANAQARLVQYRLAPEHPFPAGHDDCMGAYRQLLELGIAPDRIVLSGISAGGGLVLGVLMALRDAGLPMPAGAVALSPVADLVALTNRTGSSGFNASRDAVISVDSSENMCEMYVGSSPDARAHPYVSPALGDFTGLPPLYFQVGSTEILLDQSTRCAEKARAAGVNADVEIWPDMGHGWQCMQYLPESKRAIARISDFVRECCP